MTGCVCSPWTHFTNPAENIPLCCALSPSIFMYVSLYLYCSPPWGIQLFCCALLNILRTVYIFLWPDNRYMSCIFLADTRRFWNCAVILSQKAKKKDYDRKVHIWVNGQKYGDTWLLNWKKGRIIANLQPPLSSENVFKTLVGVWGQWWSPEFLVAHNHH